MSIEATLTSRARQHAALGEPVRLRIAAHLRFGDASPGDLAELTAQPSNLVAHHLRVLEGAGLVRKSRSEGDGRRSYVSLRLDDPYIAALIQFDSAPITVPRVMFVCTRNSARSQLAAAAWGRISPLAVISAGTHPADRVHPRAMRAARRHGLSLAARRPQQVTMAAQPGDLLVAVCDNAHEELLAAESQRQPDVPGLDTPWLHWSIPDPVRVDSDAAFDAACQEITRRVRRLAAAVAPPETGLRG